MKLMTNGVGIAKKKLSSNPFVRRILESREYRV